MDPSYPALPCCNAVESCQLWFRKQLRPVLCTRCWETNPLSLPSESLCREQGLSAQKQNGHRLHLYIPPELVMEFPSCTSKTNNPDFNISIPGWSKPRYQPRIHHTTDIHRLHPSAGECLSPPVGGRVMDTFDTKALIRSLKSSRCDNFLSCMSYLIKISESLAI